MDRRVTLKLPVLAAIADSSSACDDSFRLKDAHWSLAKEVVTTLDPFAKATTLLGGEKYCTSSVVVHVVSTLVKGFQGVLKDPSATILNFRSDLTGEKVLII